MINDIKTSCSKGAIPNCRERKQIGGKPARVPLHLVDIALESNLGGNLLIDPIAEEGATYEPNVNIIYTIVEVTNGGTAVVDGGIKTQAPNEYPQDDSKQMIVKISGRYEDSDVLSYATVTLQLGT